MEPERSEEQKQEVVGSTPNQEGEATEQMEKAETASNPVVTERLFPTAKEGTPENKQYRTWNEVEQIIRETLGDRLPANQVIHLPDAEYFLPPLQDVVEILRFSEVDRRKFINEINDCDDYAHCLKADFILAAYAEGKRRAPYAMGIIWGKLPKPHAQNWIITDDGVLRIIEPQTDVILSPDQIVNVWTVVA